MELKEKEQIEIDYWKNSSFENPSEFSRRNLLNKLEQAKNFNYKAQKYRKHFRGKSNILEIGAGQGWASCFLKKYFIPNASFTVSDISEHAIASLPYWERFFDVQIEHSYSCRSYQIPADNNSYDFIFCYAAAHHFVKTEETLKELSRVLKPKGNIAFLYEPTCSKLFYPIHFRYVNKGAHTPEDILHPGDMKEMAKRNGLAMIHHYDSRVVNLRSISLGIYFKILEKLKFLEPLLPSSSDFIFSHSK